MSRPLDTHPWKNLPVKIRCKGKYKLPPKKEKKVCTCGNSFHPITSKQILCPTCQRIKWVNSLCFGLSNNDFL